MAASLDDLGPLNTMKPAGKKKISPKVVIPEQPSDVFVVRFSTDNQLVAAGCGDGAIRVFNCTSNGRLMYTLNADMDDPMPVTCMRFRPDGATSRIRNILVTGSADGIIRHWHVTSGKCLHEIEEEDNEIYALDYRDDALVFASAGKDVTIRLYDEATKSIMSNMSGGHGDETAGHANRVFSLKFNPSDPNVLISGGWDNTIQIWDTRVDHAVRSIFGPHICGDAVDVYDNMVLSGSWRAETALQLWDYGSGKLIENIDWDLDDGEEACLLYAAQFSPPDAAYIAAGGSGSNQAKVFERSTGNVIGRVDGLTKGVYSVDFSPSGDLLAIGGGDASVRVMELRESSGSSSASAARARERRASLRI